MTAMIPRLLPAILLLLLALLPDGAGAQEGVFAPEVQMRHFWHVFIAYSIAWLFLFSWVVSILKRIRRVEDRLGGKG
jgi:CcmD family protein